MHPLLLIAGAFLGGMVLDGIQEQERKAQALERKRARNRARRKARRDRIRAQAAFERAAGRAEAAVRSAAADPRTVPAARRILAGALRRGSW
jgi:hypothetical protein